MKAQRVVLSVVLVMAILLVAVPAVFAQEFISGYRVEVKSDIAATPVQFYTVARGDNTIWVTPNALAQKLEAATNGNPIKYAEVLAALHAGKTLEVERMGVELGAMVALVDNWVEINTRSTRILYPGGTITETVRAGPGEELRYNWREAGIRSVQVHVRMSDGREFDVASTLGMYEVLETQTQGVYLNFLAPSKSWSAVDLEVPEGGRIKSVQATNTWLCRYSAYGSVNVSVNGVGIANLHMDAGSGVQALGSTFEFLVLHADIDSLRLDFQSVKADQAFFQATGLQIFYLRAAAGPTEDREVPRRFTKNPHIVWPQN
ncbi:MAG: hypothetical protein WC988_00905 [Patescibacteria group bacterium]